MLFPISEGPWLCKILKPLLCGFSALAWHDWFVRTHVTFLLIRRTCLCRILYLLHHISWHKVRLSLLPSVLCDEAPSLANYLHQCHGRESVGIINMGYLHPLDCFIGHGGKNRCGLKKPETILSIATTHPSVFRSAAVVIKHGDSP